MLQLGFPALVLASLATSGFAPIYSVESSTLVHEGTYYTAEGEEFMSVRTKKPAERVIRSTRMLLGRITTHALLGSPTSMHTGCECSSVEGTLKL